MFSIFEILQTFILQAHEGNLRTSTYPKEWSHLQMKVSFGQGILARVPWIALFAPEMQVSQGFYPVYLFFRASNQLILSYGISETAEYQSSWPTEVSEHNPTIREFLPDDVPRYGDSFVFKTYTPQVEGQEVTFVLNDSGQVTTSEAIERDLEEITNFYKRIVANEMKDEKSEISQSLFYMEKQLEDFIIHNWEQTELAERYELIVEQGELVSQHQGVHGVLQVCNG
jgi:5-methylcytosine-specific restriction protein B